MSSKPKNSQLPPLEGPARSAVVKKSKSDILGHASGSFSNFCLELGLWLVDSAIESAPIWKLVKEIIRAQSQKLKRELDHEIEKQLSVKIKAQEKAITNLKTGIESLRRENDQVCTVPGRYFRLIVRPVNRTSTSWWALFGSLFLWRWFKFLALR